MCLYVLQLCIDILEIEAFVLLLAGSLDSLDLRGNNLDGWTTHGLEIQRSGKPVFIISFPDSDAPHDDDP